MEMVFSVGFLEDLEGARKVMEEVAPLIRMAAKGPLEGVGLVEEGLLALMGLLAVERKSVVFLLLAALVQVVVVR